MSKLYFALICYQFIISWHFYNYFKIGKYTYQLMGQVSQFHNIRLEIHHRLLVSATIEYSCFWLRLLRPMDPWVWMVYLENKLKAMDRFTLIMASMFIKIDEYRSSIPLATSYIIYTLQPIYIKEVIL